jgi:hypothetical protein
MSTSAIDINDLDRLSAESKLTENAPRALPEQEPNAGIELIKTLAAMLLGRQQ